MSKISFINQSSEGYGAHQTTMCYMKEAVKRGHESLYNVIDGSVDFYVLGMVFGDYQNKLKDVLPYKKFVYIEHSQECLVGSNDWIRTFVFENSVKNLFFSPRHRQYIEDRTGSKRKHIYQDNIDYLVVPVDYEFWKVNPDIVRKNNLYLCVGLVHSNKGIYDVLKIADANPDKQYRFVGTTNGGDIPSSVFEGKPNVQYVGHKTLKELIDIYSEATACYALPTNGVVESAGRTVFEATLCGCEPLVNENVGNASYPWYKDREQIIENIKKSNDKFFNIIERFL